MNKIKRAINNTINKKLKNTKGTTQKDVKVNTEVTYSLKQASSSDLDRLYKVEAFCAEGLKDPDSDDNANFFTSHVSKWEGCPNHVNFFYCRGKDLNTKYYLTDDNMYPDNLGIFFIDWSNFGREFDASGYKGNFRYFNDVVDNNARREIRKNNPNYKNYHSLYGDEWFYSTI